jgi:hypothetical protein
MLLYIRTCLNSMPGVMVSPKYMPSYVLYQTVMNGQFFKNRKGFGRVAIVIIFHYNPKKALMVDFDMPNFDMARLHVDRNSAIDCRQLKTILMVGAASSSEFYVLAISKLNGTVMLIGINKNPAIVVNYHNWQNRYPHNPLKIKLSLRSMHQQKWYRPQQELLQKHWAYNTLAMSY